jgi:predicted dehydrogenase
MLANVCLSRRRFVGLLGAGALGLPLIDTALRADDKKPANDRINLGFIGVGTQGRGHLGAFLGMNDVQVVAVCDVVAERRDDAKKRVEEKYAEQLKSGKYTGCKTYNDFRELLGRKDIDAVVIATPDHWHAIPCIQAARAKKDIYCEKPLTHSIVEGRHIVEETAKAKIIFQVGSQQRSEYANRFRTAVELVRNGRIGKLKTVRIGVGGPAVPCDLKEEEIPKGTDWEMWQGPAPKRGYSSVLCPKGVHNHFPAWRNYREYAGGGLADMGAHHFDIAQWAMDMDHSGPVKVEPPARDTKGLKFTYANGVEMFHGGEADCVFVGTDATILVSRGKLGVESVGNPAKLFEALRDLGDKAWRCYPSSNHRRNWIECVRSRKQPICPPEVGHRTATLCHLAQIGYELRKPLMWDPMKERFDDDAANKRLDYERRGEWKL